MRYVVGVDEAGRGPLAGPVAVGVAVIPVDFDWELLPGVGDSKKLKPDARQTVFARAAELKKRGLLNFAVAQSGSGRIDRYGIVPAIRQAMQNCFEKLELLPEECSLLLDGSLYAPSEYKEQRTIIKGDATEPAIGLASILAKVTRDAYMVQKGAKAPFSAYRFDVHKGYGTKLHRQLIVKHGLSPLHRRSFCRNIYPEA